MRIALALAGALIAVSATPVSTRTPAIVQRITPNAFAYIPAAVTGPAPVIVLLHGAGGDARNFIEDFRRDADERGVILLSVQSSGRTWAQRKPNNAETDVANIKKAMSDLSGKMPFDAQRTTVMGFSDGASYSLSIGLAYPKLFRSIVAFSPGYAFAPERIDRKQRIFIAHARRDPILPAYNTREMVESLERAGYEPEMHWFNGGHQIDPQLKRAAFDFALAP